MRGIFAVIVIRNLEICAEICRWDKLSGVTVLGRGIDYCQELKSDGEFNIDLISKTIKKVLLQAQKHTNLEVLSVYVSMISNEIDVNEEVCSVDVEAASGKICKKDIDKVIYAMRSADKGNNMQITNVIPKYFIVNEQQEVVDPTGMFGDRLALVSHNIAMKESLIRNIMNCMQLIGIKINGIIAEPLALGEAALNIEQKEKGTVDIYIGRNETSVSVFKNGDFQFCGTVPLGGWHVINDISIGLDVTTKQAEFLKDECQIAYLPLIKNDNILDVNKNPREKNSKGVSVSQVVEIIEARMQEILTMCKGVLDNVHMPDNFVSSVVLTGTGIAYMDGVSELAKEVFPNVQINSTAYNFMNKLLPQDVIPIGVVKYIVSSNVDNIDNVYSEVIDTCQKEHMSLSNKIGMFLKKMLG